MLGAIQFVKNAGRALSATFNKDKGKEELEKEIEGYGLDKSGMDIVVNDDGTVSLKGKSVSQEMKEKILLAVGNVEGIGAVNDEAEVEGDGTPSQFHTIVSGDTLWAVSKKYYGKGSRYQEIFEANRPMLKHPDKIYVGQVLRIPADSKDTASA